jgi:DNA-binding SARP family transcriptional activator
MRSSRSRRIHSINVLGTFEVVSQGKLLNLRPSVQRVIALLVVRGALTKADAAGLLWLDASQARARDNLRTTLWRLRQDCPGLVSQSSTGVRIDGAAIDFVDVREWARSTLRGEGSVLSPPDAVGKELLPCWGEEWLVEPREELRLLVLYALEAAAHRLLVSGSVGEAASLVRTALGIDPVRESANRLLIEIQLRAGNPTDALRQYQRYQELLLKNLGVEPSPGLTALISSVMPSPRGLRR